MAKFGLTEVRRRREEQREEAEEEKTNGVPRQWQRRREARGEFRKKISEMKLN